jgi:hypothetical protein
MHLALKAWAKVLLIKSFGGLPESEILAALCRSISFEFLLFFITKIEFTDRYTRQITALIFLPSLFSLIFLSKYIGLYALSRPRSNLDTIPLYRGSLVSTVSISVISGIVQIENCTK